MSSFAVIDCNKTKSWLYVVLISRWFPSQCHFAFVFHMHRPALLWIRKFRKCTGLQSTTAESLFQYLNGLCQSCSTAPEGWSTSLAATPSSRHCGAITAHPMSARQYCLTYHAVSGSAVPEVLMERTQHSPCLPDLWYALCSVSMLNEFTLRWTVPLIHCPKPQLPVNTPSMQAQQKPYALAAQKTCALKPAIKD